MAYHWPPAGQSFQGFFFFIGDHYVYLSSAQQAEDGAFRFRNKLVTEPHDPALINLEWWLVGATSRAFGGRPFLAYRIVGIVASLLLFVSLSRWLRRGGLPDPLLAPALLLMATGGGFGGLLYEAGVLPVDRCLDMGTGLFPFIGLIANPHFTLATALFLESLLAFSESAPRRQALAVLLSSILALVRPYDFVLLVALRGAFVLLRHPAREWPARLISILGLLPVVALNYWMFYGNTAFAFYAKAPYVFPALLDVGLAIFPAALAATSLLLVPRASGPALDVQRQLLLWLAFGLLVIVLRPVHFSLQFLMGIGVPLLAFAAIGLGRIAPRALWIATAALGTTALVTLYTMLRPLPHWYAPREWLEAAHAARSLCRPGDVALAPPDIGRFISGLSACKAYVWHPVQPSYAERAAEVQRFYSPTDPSQRAELLDRHCIRVLVLPGDDGEQPLHWLPAGTAFRRTHSLSAGGRTVSLYARRSDCGP